MLLEGHGRKRESTGIRRDASSPLVRAQNRAEAEAVYHARMVQLAREKVGLPISTSMTFAKWTDWYDEHHIEKHRGRERERVMLARLRKHFGPMVLSTIKPARWTEYETARIAEGVSKSTVGRELSLMKSILVSAVGEHLDVSPLAHVKRPKVKVPPKRTLTNADEKRLLEAMEPGKVRGGSFGDAELLDLYLLGVGTLLRQQNLVFLQRKHLHGARLTVETKTGPHALSLDGPTPLQRRCLPILKRRLPKTHTGYFFPTWAKRFTGDQQGGNKMFLQAFRRACRRAGIPWGLRNSGVVWHTATRASGATRMLREHGVDIRTVQLLGGWSSLDQMAAYLGLDLATPSARTARGRKVV